MTNDGMARLKAEIVLQAVNDYRLLTKLRRNKMTMTGYVITKGSLIRFLESEWCRWLCNTVDPKRILEQLRKEEQNYENKYRYQEDERIKRRL